MQEVATVLHPTTVNEIVSIVKNASAQGIPVRASGLGHMWYGTYPHPRRRSNPNVTVHTADTMCSDDPRTIIIQTNATNAITDFNLPAGASEGSVWVEAGTTFFEL